MEKLVEIWNNIIQWFSNGNILVWLQENLSTIALWIIGIIGTSIFTKTANKVLEWFKTKTKNEKTKNLIEKAKNIIHSVTDATTQSFVSELKKFNKFTQEKQAEAFKKTLEESKNLLTKDLKKAVEEEYKDLNTFIGTEIESYLHTEKSK